jgi:FtsP/CotA-like multicopper oxidase with cupredoxin domain
LAVPLCKIPIQAPDVTQRVDLEFKSNDANFIWYLNNQTYRGNYDSPVLLDAKDCKTNYEPEWIVYQFLGAKHVRIHLVNNGQIGGHPTHLHGHDFHILAEGYSEWDGSIDNSGNALRRELHQLQNEQTNNGTVTPSYMVLQFEQDNPGAWPLHYHLAWHVSEDLFIQILERPEDIIKHDFDQDIFTLCDKWDAYTASNAPNQIDSGL